MDGLGVDRDEGGTVHVVLEPAVPGHAGAWVLSSELVDPSGFEEADQPKSPAQELQPDVVRANRARQDLVSRHEPVSD